MLLSMVVSTAELKAQSQTGKTADQWAVMTVRTTMVASIAELKARSWAGKAAD